ncbi:MAG: 4Fe-4S dicluster domain-containing protein, partial [candidate division WOR-3 bacterium]
CGDCVDVCYFKAREMKDDRLVITRQNCYGCGLCANVCPESVIRMWKR